MAKRLSKGEKAEYDFMRRQGLTDEEARRSIQSTRNAVGNRPVPF